MSDFVEEYTHVPLQCDSTSAISVAKNPVSYGPPRAHYLGGYQDRLLGGPLGLPNLCRTVPDGMRRKDYGGEVLG
jgi:hypothetical protein